MTTADKPTPARTRRGADRRREIVDAARRAFAERGYDGASMADIAATVGIVEGAVYKHFPSKRALLYESIRSVYEPLIAETRDQLAGVRGTRNRLRFAIWRQLAGYKHAPELCRLIIEEVRPRSDYRDSVVGELNREMTSIVRSIIEEGIARGELRADVSPALVRDVVHGGSEHLAWKALCGQDAGGHALDVDGLADELTEFVWRGAAVSPSDAGGDAIDRLENRVARLEGALEPTAPRGADDDRRGERP